MVIASSIGSSYLRRNGSELSPDLIDSGNRAWFLLNTFILQRHLRFWDIITLAIACASLYGYMKGKMSSDRNDKNQASTSQSAGKLSNLCSESRKFTMSFLYSLLTASSCIDPGLLKKHSVYKSYHTSIASYPRIRTFYHPHPHANKLPNNPKPLPLLVCIHGLGGSLLQFNLVLTSMVNTAPCFGIDFPGCGKSSFSPRTWKAYSHQAMCKLLAVAISQACEASSTKEVILIGHSMGCSVAASLCSSTYKQVGFQVIGMIAICPKASVPSTQQVKIFKRLLMIPTPLFDLWRLWDRRGGVKSASVGRFVGDDASAETKVLQLRFNAQSRTGVWRRMAWGALSSDDHNTGLPSPSTWAAISVSLFLVAGEADHVTKAEEVRVICEAIDKVSTVRKFEEHTPVQQTDLNLSVSEYANISTHFSTTHRPEISSKGRNASRLQDTTFVVETSILPSPAGHGLLYDSRTYRTLSGLIQTFLSDHIDYRLSPGWQLRRLKDANKWDVKNLAKWQAVKPVSEPIAGIFRAMKTLREVDMSHSPGSFVSEWEDRVKAVIDISHESPVYSPQGLEHGGIAYHKFPTVSKIPPTPEEVRDFIILVDSLRVSSSADDVRLIGVHCHYGFNRTGFFVCSYLIERENFSVPEAIDEFHLRRPPGIRHEHFIDTLFARYCIGLKRAPTV